MTGEGISDDVRNYFENSINELKKIGAKVENVSVPYIKESLPVYYLTAPSEASSNLNRYDGIKYGLSDNKHQSSWEVIKNTSNFGEEVKGYYLGHLHYHLVIMMNIMERHKKLEE